VLVNGGPDPVEVAQVTVDDAYWSFEIEPTARIPRLGRATLTIPYPWVEGEAHALRVITSTGATFESEVEVALETPRPGLREFAAYGLLGVYVGIIPVALGMLWFPAMRRMGRRWLGAILAMTVGLLIFLLIDTFLEAMEVAEGLVGAFQGVPLILFAALITWLVLLAVGGRGHRRPAAARRWRQPSKATHFRWIGAPSGRARHPGDLGGRLRVLTAARHHLLGDRRGRHLAGDR